MPALETLLYVLPKWERQSAVPTGILVRLFPGSGHQWLIDQCATAARPSVLHAGRRFSSLTVSVRTFRLFTSVCGSTTVTTPALRLRCAVPVGHHVRVRWCELPASCSTRRMVLVPTCGKSAVRRLRCKVLSDQVAGPVGTPIGLSLGSGHNASARTRRIRRPPPATGRDAHRGQAVAVEPTNQISHRCSAAQARLARGPDEHPGPRDLQEGCRSTHLIDPFATAGDDALQCRPLRTAHAAQRIALWCGHAD